MRTTETTVTFSYPFRLGAMDEHQPAGTYRVLSDEEEVPTLSTLVLRRTASFLHTPAIDATGRCEVYAISPAELAKAQAEDLWHAQAIAAERTTI